MKAIQELPLGGAVLGPRLSQSVAFRGDFVGFVSGGAGFVEYRGLNEDFPTVFWGFLKTTTSGIIYPKTPF